MMDASPALYRTLSAGKKSADLRERTAHEHPASGHVEPISTLAIWFWVADHLRCWLILVWQRCPWSVDMRLGGADIGVLVAGGKGARREERGS